MNLIDDNLYYVGGYVRDQIIGVPSFDIDYCYEGDAIAFAKKSGLNIIKINPDFGTVRVLFQEQEIDIASTRTEIYPKKGHLPFVSHIGCSLIEDLARRDFSINAIAKRTTDGEFIDIYNGMVDIKEKNIRVLHDESFIDDPTRIVRALKFSVRFGFDLDKKTNLLQKEYLENINYDISYHRLKKELVETFNLNSQEGLIKFIDNGIYKLLGQKSFKYFQMKNVIIKDFITEDIDSNNIWLIYLSFFDLSNLELTRAEKRIITWSNRLEQELPSNNTPKESIIINNIKNAINCKKEGLNN